MPQIVYFLPSGNSPSGGVKVLLQHVEILNRHGFDAFAFGLSNFQSWADINARVVRSEKDTFLVSHGSFLVFPETERIRAEHAAKSDNFVRVVFCQNHYAMEWGALADVRRFRDNDAFVCSSVIADAFKKRFGVPHVPVVPVPVDAARFKPAVKQPLTVAYMPRKRPGLVERLRDAIPEASAWNWLPIDRVPEAEVARILGGASVFLSLSHQEGLGLPPLEAMAAECIVAGFHGDGGRCYATPDNGFWHDDEDLAGVAASLRKAVHLAAERTGAWAAMIAAGRRTVEQFSPAATETALLTYWRSRIRAVGRQETEFLLRTSTTSGSP